MTSSGRSGSNLCSLKLNVGRLYYKLSNRCNWYNWHTGLQEVLPAKACVQRNLKGPEFVWYIVWDCWVDVRSCDRHDGVVKPKLQERLQKPVNFSEKNELLLCSLGCLPILRYSQFWFWFTIIPDQWVSETCLSQPCTQQPEELWDSERDVPNEELPCSAMDNWKKYLQLLGCSDGEWTTCRVRLE